MIVLKAVSFSYGKEMILKDIDLRINEGEFVGIIGPNGSGKTTLLKLMNGLLIPNAGEVEVDGMKTNIQEQNWEIKKIAGYVFQNPENQIVGITVEEDLVFGMENVGLPVDEMKRRIKEVLQFVGLEGFEKRSVNSLSGGQKQRLAVASILAIGPKYFLFDEPTSMLDPNSRKDFLQVLKKLRESGKTIVMISHDLEELIECNRLLFIYDGRVLLDDKPVKALKDILENGEMIKYVDIPDSIRFQILLEKYGLIDKKDYLLKKIELIEVVKDLVNTF
ncbi:MAG: energy-coupling factor transport system ATP-binding protein [Thermotogaceae bacterium]|jgi:energy-coupling factor transport system ATP-binding protein|nr:energy-coupling factor transport system ATP-binding protein [Thermotogaceae bacterium]